jgi:hypothetical protein
MLTDNLQFRKRSLFRGRSEKSIPLGRIFLEILYLFSSRRKHGTHFFWYNRAPTPEKTTPLSSGAAGFQSAKNFCFYGDENE